MPRRMITRLPDARGQAEVAAELIRCGEAGDVADRGQHDGGGDRTHTGNRHQREGSWIIKAFLGEDLVDLGQLLGDAFEFQHQTRQYPTLLRRKRQPVQPLLAGLAEQVALVRWI